MAQQISLGATSFPVGERQYTIDSLPANSEGFEMALGIGASWRSTSPGPLFTVVCEIALDGTTYVPWRTFTAQGGNVLTPTGAQLNTFYVASTWPGENDGSGGRRKLRGQSLRFSVTVHQAFTATSVDIRTF